MARAKPFYGWVIVAAGMLIIAAGVGGISNCTSLFIVPMCEDFGFSRKAVNATQTVYAIAGMFATLAAGRLMKPRRIKALILIGSAIACLSFALYTVSTRLWHLYVLSATMAMGQALCAFLPFSVILCNWFHRRQGLAIGLTFMGSGVGGMVFNALAGQWIELWGWRCAIRLLTGSAFCVIVPILLFVIKLHPSEVGQRALGEEHNNPDAERAPLVGPDMRAALTSRKGALMLACMLAIGMEYVTISALLSPHLMSEGYSGVFAANSVSLLMAMLAVGKILLGVLYDRLGVRGATMVALGALGVSLVGMLLVKNSATLVLVVLGGGLGCSLGTITPSVFARRSFGTRDYGAISGAFFAANNFGAALSPFIGGWIYDLSGSYMPLYALMLAALAVTVPVLWFALGRSQPFENTET